MPQNDMDKCDKAYKYLVNGLFGNDYFESISRVTLVTDSAAAKKWLDAIIDAQRTRQSIVATKENSNIYQELMF